MEGARGEERPEERVGREEEGRELWEVAKAVLTEEQFGAVWLYYVEEMTAGEVARVLGRSWVGVKTMLHRARKRLGLKNSVRAERARAAVTCSRYSTKDPIWTPLGN